MGRIFKDFVLLYGENSNIHQSRSQNDSRDLKGVVRGDGKLGCLCWVSVC